MFLTYEQIVELTHYTQAAAQKRALTRMGISFKPRPDGSPAVFLKHVEKLLDGFKKNKVESNLEPNWDTVT